MAVLRTKITSRKPKDFEESVIKEMTNRYSARRRRVELAVEEEINAAIESSKALLQPHRGPLGGEEMVGMLGIGDETSKKPAIEKMRNVYKLLQPVRRGRFAKMSSQFKRRADRFGNITYTASLTNIYKANLATYTSYSGGRKRIPWLQNFIHGIETPDHAYVDKFSPMFHPDSSRTGIGHMVKKDFTVGKGRRKRTIPGRQFSFDGVGEAATFGVIFDRIAARLRKPSFIKKIESIIAG